MSAAPPSPPHLVKPRLGLGCACGFFSRATSGCFSWSSSWGLRSGLVLLEREGRGKRSGESIKWQDKQKSVSHQQPTKHTSAADGAAEYQTLYVFRLLSQMPMASKPTCKRCQFSHGAVVQTESHPGPQPQPAPYLWTNVTPEHALVSVCLARSSHVFTRQATCKEA